ncbi:MAG TPA: hypothetical protein PLP29_12145 [Candidatus Ozemobacteraceae bacterium]|nr:hypothetical protein [Candidatus Ozemobacteraceae bacterium]
MARLIRVALLAAVMAFSLLPAHAQHAFYKQNGDCYLLISGGPAQGVYALNNLTNGPVRRLYDPSDSAFGIAACQTWSDRNGIEKWLYTFVGKTRMNQRVTGEVSVPVNTVDWKNASVGYPGERWDEKIITSYHCGRSFISPTGIGPHGPNDYCTAHYMVGVYGYNGDYPCYWRPRGDPKKPGNCLIDISRYYHSFIRVRDYTSYYGGWTHWVVRDNITADFRDISLHRWDVARSILNGTGYPQAIASVKTRVVSTQSRIHECPDGCQRAQPDVPMPSETPPFVDFAYSTKLGRAYLYQREPNSRDYTLVGPTAASSIIGDPTNLTTRSIAISSKGVVAGAYGDWIYLLGKDEINKWLQRVNVPFRISNLDDVAVSDQWWQTGGIVYAFDKSQKRVFKFIRNERAGTMSIPEQIVVNADGIVPDSISADGYGNLYLVRTERKPANPATSFLPTDAVRYARTGTDILGTPIYTAYFNQLVTKSVFKRDYYAGGEPKPISQKVVIGTNFYQRSFVARTPTDRSTWIWQGNPSLMPGTRPVDENCVAELATINVATPPEVNRKDGSIDIVGPLAQGATGALERARTPYTDTNTYFFEVENSPRFDVNGVNVGSTNVDQDGDTWIGGFPSTTKQSTIKYYWKIIQLKDRYGVEMNGGAGKVLLDQEADNTPTANYQLPVNLPGGDYRIGCRCTFKFYDYTSIDKVGVLSDEKEKYLSGELVAKSKDGTGYSWVDIHIQTVPLVNFPGGVGMIMSGMPSGGGYQYRPQSPMDGGTSYCNPSIEQPTGPRFVVPEKFGNWSFKLRDSNYNISRNKDRLAVGANLPASMLSVNPPDPRDNRMVAGTLKWMSEPSFTWATELKRGTEGLVSRQAITKEPVLSYADVKTLFPLPSQPRSYKLQVNGSRSYSYQTYIPKTYWMNGELITDWELTTMPKTIKIAAECEVVVTDETGPAETFPDPFDSGKTVQAFFMTPNYLYGTTGEKLADVEAPPVQNPFAVEYVVADNNPMGNDFATDNPSLLTWADPFFGPVQPRCRVSHNPNKRFASFRYLQPLLSGQMLPGAPTSADNLFRTNPNTAIPGPTAKWALEQRDIVKADFGTTVPWISQASYNKCFSYRRYILAFSTLSQNAAFSANNSPEMPLDYANNTPGYQNFRYGLTWAEACGLQTPETNSPFLKGQIVIRDNDRPNAFVKGEEAKNEGVLYYAPTNILPDKMSKWYRFAAGETEANHNGVLTWSGMRIAGFASAFRVPGKLDVVGKMTAYGSDDAQFEIDVPTFFTAMACDNTIGVATVSFTLTKGGDLLADGTTQKNIRYIFREPGTDYHIRLTIDDQALNWPSDANRPTFASAKRNRRVLDCIVEVLRTRLDIRVIDRTNQGR